MHRSLESVLAILHTDEPVQVSREDFDGPHGLVWRHMQAMGFVATEGVPNPVPTCPECLEGSPYFVSERYLCPVCREDVDEVDLLVWRFDRMGLLRWLADEWSLRGGIERIADELWRLGTLTVDGHPTECFYVRGGEIPDPARGRLLVFRNALVMHGSLTPPSIPGFEGRILALAEAMEATPQALTVRPLQSTSRPEGLSLNPESGEFRLGTTLLGHVPPGSREFHFLEHLIDRPSVLIPYADLKHQVARLSGSRDETDEATYCQKLKWRLKNVHGIAAIDRLVVTDRKLGGYRLLAEATLDDRGSLVGA